MESDNKLKETMNAINCSAIKLIGSSKIIMNLSLKHKLQSLLKIPKMTKILIPNRSLGVLKKFHTRSINRNYTSLNMITQLKNNKDNLKIYKSKISLPPLKQKDELLPRLNKTRISSSNNYSRNSVNLHLRQKCITNFIVTSLKHYKGLSKYPKTNYKVHN